MEKIAADELPFEFMMNALRLNQGVPTALYAERTGLEIDAIAPTLEQLRQKKLLQADVQRIACTEHGHMYLNSVLDAFL